MKPIFALEPLPKSIFLAGPTPRDEATPSWRPEALRILEELKFEGNVMVPEAADWAAHDHYDSQVGWEWEALETATAVVFWVPRNFERMPAFTTNVEFGLMVHSGKALLGYPPEAPKMRYLRLLGERYGVPCFYDLNTLLAAAVARTRQPYQLNGGVEKLPQ